MKGRRRINFVLGVTIVLATFTSSEAAGALPDSSLRSRNFRQQMFASDYAPENEPPTGFLSAEEVVSFIEGLAQAWSEAVASESPAYRRLNAYVPMWTLSTLLKHPVSDEAKCLVWARFAAPSFIADVEFLLAYMAGRPVF